MNNENKPLENQIPSTDLDSNVVTKSEEPIEDISPKENINPFENGTVNQEEIVSLSPAPSEDESTSDEPIIDSGHTDANQVPPIPLDAEPASNGVIPQNPVASDVPDVNAKAIEDKPKKSNKPLIVVLCLLVVGALGYFVGYPMIKNQFMSNPKNVFETTINSLNKSLNATITNTNLGTSINEIRFSFKSSVQELKEFENYTYGARFGIDNKEKAIEGKLFLLDGSKKEYSAAGYVKNGNILAKLSSDDRLVNLGKTSEIEGFDSIFDAVESVDVSDYTYLVDKSLELLIKSFDEKDFAKSKSTMTVNGVNIDVTKNTYILNKEKIKKIYKNITDGLYNDDKAMKIIEKSGITKEEFKKSVDEEDFSDLDDSEVNINIYTNKKSDVVGFDVVNGKFTPISYYTNEGNFDLVVNEDEKNSNSITAKGVVSGDVTNVNIKYNNETIITLKISKWTETEKVFDYEVKIEDQSISGTIDYKNNKNNTANNMDLKFSLKSGSDFVNVELNLKQELNVKLASDIDVGAAKTLSDEEKATWMSDFIKSLENTPLGFVISTLGGINDMESIEEQADFDDSDFDFDAIEDSTDDSTNLTENFEEDSF